MRSHITTAWFAAMAVGGVLFGLVAERRPFGDDIFAHPFVALFIATGAGLVMLRVAAARPVPELIPERMLLFGCLVGAVGFLAGNWLGTHVLAMR